MSAIVLIPARLAATRLPQKPLADIAGVPMIVRVLRRAEAAGVGAVAVAAGDREIVEAVEAAGGRAVLTDPDLPSGSDRVLAALKALDPHACTMSSSTCRGTCPSSTPPPSAPAPTSWRPSPPATSPPPSRPRVRWRSAAIRTS